MKFSSKSRQKIYCEYVSQLDQEKSPSIVALASDPELLNVPMEVTFDIDSVNGYVSSLTLY